MAETGALEEVVLVDDHGSPVGRRPKATVHGASTPRHLAFSCHILRGDGRLLITRRALGKLTWPGVWTNSVCGHPMPGELTEDAVRRRAAFELGMQLGAIECVLPDFGYTARDASGIQENEHCPVFIAEALTTPAPNPDEVAEIQWTRPDQLIAATDAAPWAFSPWLVGHLPAIAPHLRREAVREHA